MLKNGLGTKKEEGKALALFEVAASKGCLHSLHILAHAYDEGDNCDRDERKAFRYFKKAAKSEDPCVLFHLAAMYGEGRGVEKNISKAIKYFQRAAAAGHEGAPGALQKIAEGAKHNSQHSTQ